jgi:Rad3-related DNA helicase
MAVGTPTWERFWPSNQEIRQATDMRGPCQRALLDDWWDVLHNSAGHRHLLAHAPTGLGKTLAGIVPALAWLAESPDSRRVFYLVNRVFQHENPLREIRRSQAGVFFAATGEALRVVDLVGREKLCIHPGVRSLDPLCRDSREHATFAALPSLAASWQEVRDHLSGRSCPYHTLQGLARSAHLVICDYAWIFSRAAVAGKLDHLLGDGQRAVIVDEAHNLPGRVRQELDIDTTVDRIKAALAVAPPEVTASVQPVVQAVQDADPESGINVSELSALAGGTEVITALLDALRSETSGDSSVSLPQRILQFLLLGDVQTAVYSIAQIPGQARLIFRVVDPAPILRRGYESASASLSMSGTLAAPADDSEELAYQVPLFGLPPVQTISRRYASPFPQRNRQWIYCEDTLGVLKYREQHIPRYVEHVTELGKITPGVTAVFFSSYQFLQQVLVAMPPEEQALVIAEERGDVESSDSVDGVEAYRRRLQDVADTRTRAYLFAVYQGKIAEGADFPDNLIKTVICVSIPLEWPELFHRRLAERYQVLLADLAMRRGDDPTTKAREYAVDRFPLSQVLQACGRGIRQMADRCAFVLLDKRYGPGRGNYDWRRFLQPRPYNLAHAAVTVQRFLSPVAFTESGKWDPKLLAACASAGGGRLPPTVTPPPGR